MALIRWTPIAHLADVQEELNRLLDHSLRRTVGQGNDGGFLPPCDIVEEKDQLLVSLDMPGLPKEDVTVTLQDGVLTIKGERKVAATTEESQWYVRERGAGTFTRTITLPIAVDAGKIEARFQDGVLASTLPKAEEAKPKQIEVKVG
jgi:HSP20 family protein